MIKTFLLGLILTSLFYGRLFAQITMPKVFGDSMVLQREQPIPVWGQASPGTPVTGTLGAAYAKTVTGKDGKWMLRFPAAKAGGPYTLKVSGGNVAIEFKNVLIGDVWLASGQSNMEWPVKDAKDAAKEIAASNWPQIRFLVVKQRKSLTPQQDITDEKWKACDPATTGNFSAVAYYFARKVHQEQGIPVGIIQSTWGGTPVEAWTGREGLLASPITRARVLANDTLEVADFVQDSLNLVRFWDIIYHPQNNAAQEVPADTFNDAAWPQVQMPALVGDFGGPYEGIVWMRKKIGLPASFAGKALTVELGHPEMNYSLYVNGHEICKTVWSASPFHHYTVPAAMLKSGENVIALRIAMLWGGGGLNPPADSIYVTDGTTRVSLAGTWRYQKDAETPAPHIRNYQCYPAVLYNAMIHPLIPYAIKGVIWYQGEANEYAAFDYRQLFPGLIKDWRIRWTQGNFPFLYVQLANFKKIKPEPSESEWAEVREAQAMTLSQPNTGMACIIDLGEAGNIHPANKQEVGRRLTLVAGKQVYHRQGIASGPAFAGFKKEPHRIRIRFTNTGAGLTVRDGHALTGFAIAGEDKRFYWANAVIEGNEVVVSSEQVLTPTAVRYAWADNPVCNLVNSAGLPAIPFRTDSWKGITQR
ncbi:sialate O-acetylesterase [Chitinophaga qingshengii]|uniref:Sialate O-acetylesterase n=1 Tax=Chitinophaga qingshengii TaxID=1569794 RepID=A0ABR7TQG2_9BACT|nr:sialate O-acetylesterase [Chitinophaga qingshengii]MBC9932721.1 sialate O-acetylesterase [Chitinophaga qingshengii]